MLYNFKLITMSEETLDLNQETGKRPTFLTVLCILTFIGSGWGIISSLAMSSPELDAYAGYYKWVSALLCVGTLVGAFQMWGMKKMGLYVWTACEVISVVLMWVVIKGFLASIMDPATNETATEVMSSELGKELGGALASSANSVVEGAMNMALMIGSIFPAVFIILYWINAKHLK